MKTKKHISQEELKEKLMRALTISFIIYLFFSCTYHKANDSMKKKSIIAQPDTIQERKESFEYFIKEFHKDRTIRNRVYLEKARYYYIYGRCQ